MAFPSSSALRVFDAAARLGSFKAAAKDLGVTATAVSHQIRNLEAQLGVALFVRGTRKIDLTAVGKTLFAATGPAFREIGTALEEISGADHYLTLTTTPAFAALWLIPRIRAFETAHPNIHVHVDTSTHPVDIGRDRRIDLAIRYSDTPPLSDDSDVLIEEKVGAFAAPGHMVEAKDVRSASLLETIWRSETLTPITWADWFTARGEVLPEIARIRRFDEEQHVINAGLAGQGIMLVSKLLVQDLVARGWLVPIAAETALPGFRYFVITTPNKQDTRKVRLFLKWLRQEMSVF